jgi:hypothetical protein
VPFFYINGLRRWVYDNAFTAGGVAWRRLHGMALGVVILNYIEGDNRQLILT